VHLLLALRNIIVTLFTNISFFNYSPLQPKMSEGDDSVNVSVASILSTDDLGEADAQLLDMEVTDLRALLEEAIKSQDPEISKERLEVRVAVKIGQAKRKIPLRWKADEDFSAEFQKAEELYACASAIARALQAKEKDDKSAEIEIRNLQQSLEVWNSSVQPAFEQARDAAAKVWYKPGTDPIWSRYSKMFQYFSSLSSELQFEISSRPLLESLKGTDKTAPTTFTLRQEPRSIIHFDVAKFIGAKFSGDQDDSDVLLKFNNWKSSWENLVKEMKTMPGFDDKSLFKKLKDCLDGHALQLVSKYSAESNNSYDTAIQELLQRFEDPIGLAGCYMASATNRDQDEYEKADAMLQSYNALHGMRDIFDKEGVNMYDFAIINAYVSSMTPNMQVEWNGYKVKRKEEYRQKVIVDPSLPKWQAGMVENHAVFTSWLKLFYAKKPQSTTSSIDATSSISTGANFAIAGSSKMIGSGKECFLCLSHNPDNHSLTRCPVALKMSQSNWVQACKKAKRCYKCVAPYSDGHKEQCRIVCKLCYGREYQTDHFVLMCPRNKFRAFPPQQKASSGGMKRKLEDNKGTGRDMEKMMAKLDRLDQFCTTLAANQKSSQPEPKKHKPNNDAKKSQKSKEKKKSDNQ